MGLTVRRVDRGDLVHMTLGQRSDLLLVDEANSVADSILKALSLEGEKNGATTTVFFGLPSCAARLICSNVHHVIIELAPLPPSDARNYLLERANNAGLPDLFTSEALELTINGSHGSPRLLRSIAGLAFFGAASDGSSQISLKHVASALSAQVQSGTQDVAERTLQVPSADETPKSPAVFPSDAEAVYPYSQDVEMPAESQSTADQFRTDVHSRQTATKRRKNLEYLSGDSIVSTRVSRRTLVAAISIVIAAAAVIATVLPMQEGTSLYSTTRLNSPPAPVQTSDFAEPAPALPPTASNEAEGTVRAAPVLNNAENVTQAEKKTSGRIAAAKKSVPGAAQGKTVTHRPLTVEEKAAVARGIREIERAATQVAPP